MNALTHRQRWRLSFYRESELGGSLFFGRLARLVRGPCQADLTRHFADEAQHAHWWTRCLADCGTEPCRVPAAYQDRFLEEGGIPASFVEVLALTQVFEARVVGEYTRHLRLDDTPPAVQAVLERILLDERRHLAWVGQALDGRRGEADVDALIHRFRRADTAAHGIAEAELHAITEEP